MLSDVFSGWRFAPFGALIGEHTAQLVPGVLFWICT